MSVFSSNWLKLQPQLPSKQKGSPCKGKRKRSNDEENGQPKPKVKRPKHEADEVPQVKKTKKIKKTQAVPTLDSMIQLELGRWEIMDNLVEAYDQHISPVLGGNDTSRNEQKRKRHLEAWLWSRLFFPLLPLGEPTAAAVAAGDEALIRKLCNAGLSKKDARRRMHRLATVLSSDITSSSADVEVRVEQSALTSLKCGKRQVQLLPEYLGKLKALTRHKSEDFNKAAFLLLARYRILQVHDKGGGNQGAIPPAVFNTLKEWWSGSEPLEAFASPLNTLAGKGCYHSAFSDTDIMFGSRGSFFDANFHEGLIEVNPPFDEALVLRTAHFCQSCLEEAELGQRRLAFVIIIPETDWSGHAAFLESKFKKWSLSLPSGSHFYQVGNQHINRQRSYPASRNTTVLLLATSLIKKTKQLQRRIDEAFGLRP